MMSIDESVSDGDDNDSNLIDRTQEEMSGLSNLDLIALKQLIKLICSTIYSSLVKRLFAPCIYYTDHDGIMTNIDNRVLYYRLDKAVLELIMHTTCQVQKCFIELLSIQFGIMLIYYYQYGKLDLIEKSRNNFGWCFLCSRSCRRSHRNCNSIDYPIICRSNIRS